MFAIIETGAKQYKVAKDQVFKSERISGEVGEEVTLEKVLAVFDGKAMKVGVAAAKVKVTAKILEHSRGAKVKVFKKKRRKDYQRTQGHRQNLTVLQVTGIQ